MLLDFDEAVTEIWSVDCQNSASSGVIVQVAGSLQCKVSTHVWPLPRRHNAPCIPVCSHCPFTYRTSASTSICLSLDVPVRAGELACFICMLLICLIGCA